MRSLFCVQSRLLEAELSTEPGRGEAAALTALTERISAAGRPFRM